MKVNHDVPNELNYKEVKEPLAKWFSQVVSTTE
jgi:hypothetical protein